MFERSALKKLLLKTVRIFFYILYLGITVLLLLFSSIIIFQSVNIYRYIKKSPRCWLPTFNPDESLGFRPKTNHLGGYEFYDHTYRMKFNENGIQISESVSRSERSKTMLTLGCSYSEGASVGTDNTYTMIASEIIDAYPLNAAVSSYGLSQMLLLAREFIPEIKPDFVVVQYSPWLTDRACKLYFSSLFSHVPAPYFINNSNGLKIQKPPYLSKKNSLPLYDYRHSKQCFFDFISYMKRFGVPFCLHNYLKYYSYEIMRELDQFPNPTKDFIGVVDYVYSEISKLCQKHNVNMIILIFCYPEPPSEYIDVLDEIDGVSIVNGYEILCSKLPVNDKETYYDHYGLKRGDPPELVDEHPNKNAHLVLGQAIANHILNYDINNQRN